MAQNRITIKNLDALCERLNKATGSPMTPWAQGVAQIGNYHISQAYGGYCLHRMHSAAGGITCPLSGGHGPARALYGEIRGMLAGIDAVTSI
jgi:hypothetical protein